MENILRSILETEKETERIVADARIAAQKMSQEASELAERLRTENQKVIREKVDTYLSKVRQEAAQAKDKILAEAQVQMLERQAEANMSRAVAVVLDSLLPTS